MRDTFRIIPIMPGVLIDRGDRAGRCGALLMSEMGEAREEKLMMFTGIEQSEVPAGGGAGRSAAD